MWTRIRSDEGLPIAGSAPLPSGCELAFPSEVDIGADGKDDVVVVFQCGDATRIEAYDLKF